MPDVSSFPDSKHFSIQPLADGIHAVLFKEGGSAICNSGIIDLGGISLVFDTFLTPCAARELHQAVVHLVGQEPDFVINSHYHNDHVWGNQEFSPPLHIVASYRTCQLMRTAGKKELEDEKATAVQSLSHFRDLYREADSDEKREAALLFLGYFEGLVQDLPRLKVRFPDILYKGRLAFHGTKRSAELISFDDCHTGNDALLFLPEEGILFMSDLLFTGCHPYLGDGDPINLLHSLEEIKSFKADRFVSGHGPVGTREDLNLMIEYIETCLRTARTLIKGSGVDEEKIMAQEIPQPFRQWKVSSFYYSNLKALCKMLSSD